MNLLGAAQPEGQRTGHGQRNGTQHHGENRRRHDALAEHLAGLTEIAGPDEMSHLHRETHGRGTR